MRYWKLWLSFAFVIVASFGVLGFYGHEIYLQAPPIPKRVVDTEGNVLFTEKDIRDGQNVWQSMGGQEIGSVWGHGAYQAPDWSADWLHRDGSWWRSWINGPKPSMGNRTETSMAPPKLSCANASRKRSGPILTKATPGT